MSVDDEESVLTTLKSIVERTSGGSVQAASLADNANLFDECAFDSLSIVDFVVEVEGVFRIDGALLDPGAEMPQTIEELADMITRSLHDQRDGKSAGVMQ